MLGEMTGLPEILCQPRLGLIDRYCVGTCRSPDESKLHHYALCSLAVERSVVHQNLPSTTLILSATAGATWTVLCRESVLPKVRRP